MPHVTEAEARILAAAVHGQVGYLHRLRERMVNAGRRDDPLYARVRAALDAAHALWVNCHSRGCGVDRPPAEGPGVADESPGGVPAG